VKLNRRQRRSQNGATDELLDQTDGEVEDARADSDGDLDPLAGLGSDDLDSLDDTDGLGEDDLEGDGARVGRRGRRGTGTLVEPETEAPVARPRPSIGGAPGPARTTPRQFLHEVNVEMRKVAWPTRKETINYASVVFVTLAVLMAMIFGLDYGFNHLAIYLFK